METPSEGSISIDYSCSESERQHGSALLGLQPAKRRFGDIVGWVLFVGAAVLLFYYYKSGDISPHTVAHSDRIAWSNTDKIGAASVTIGLALVLVSWVLIRKARLREHNRWVVTQASFEPRGLIMRRPGKATVQSWPSFECVLESNTLLVLRMRGGDGFVFPKRLFTSDEECALVARNARQFIEGAATPEQNVPSEITPLTFSLTLDEWREANQKRRDRILAAVNPHSDDKRELWLEFWRLLAALIGALLVLAGLIVLALKHAPSLIPWGFVILGVWLIAMISSRKKNREAWIVKQFTSQPEVAGPFSVELTPNLLKYRAPRFSNEFDWTAIRALRASNSSLFVIDDEQRTTTIPKRAFTSDESRDQFIEFIVSRIRENGSRA